MSDKNDIKVRKSIGLTKANEKQSFLFKAIVETQYIFQGIATCAA